jgi:hypothetical protein
MTNIPFGMLATLKIPIKSWRLGGKYCTVILRMFNDTVVNMAQFGHDMGYLGYRII